MLKETIALETLRQKIEKAEFDAGDASDFLDYGKPSESQVKQNKEFIAKKMAEAEILKTELHALIEASPKEAVEEWANWHKDVLQKIMLEPQTNTQSKVRGNTARATLAEWDKVLQREQDFVRINWYYLKDYKAKAIKDFKSGWWKL